MTDGDLDGAMAPSEHGPDEGGGDQAAPSARKRGKRRSPEDGGARAKKKGQIDLSKVVGSPDEAQAAAAQSGTPSAAAPPDDVLPAAEAAGGDEGGEDVPAAPAGADDGPGDATPEAVDVADGESPVDASTEESPEEPGEESGEEPADDEAVPSGPEPSDAALRAAVEAIIFAADDPVTPNAIAKAIGDVKPSAVKRVIDLLQKEREESGSGIAIEEVAGGWTMLTREEYAPAIRRLRKAAESRKLTGAALETLAVVAYKQPIQKQEIEDIRGVSCGPILRTLMEQGLVKIAGRAEALGRPLLYGTTKRFLDVFGIAALKDLPKISELTQG